MKSKKKGIEIIEDKKLFKRVVKYNSEDFISVIGAAIMLMISSIYLSSFTTGISLGLLIWSIVDLINSRKEHWEEI